MNFRGDWIMNTAKIILIVFCSCVVIVMGCNSNNPTQPAGSSQPVPTKPFPANGATGITRTPVLSWSFTPPDSGDTIRYEVYIGTVNAPFSVLTLIDSVKSYSFLGLDTNKVYNWKVIAKDTKGHSFAGPTWHFTTLHDSIGPLHDPFLFLQFNDYPYNHNMHIVTDGKYYYTVNGGDTAHGKIQRYTLKGIFIDSVHFPFSFRSIMYNKADKYLYVSTYLGNVYRIANYDSGKYALLYTGLFTNAQAAAALSDDGKYFYGFNSGTLVQYNVSNGTIVQTFTGLQYGGDGNADAVVAVDDKYIYTWNSSTLTVYYYTLEGMVAGQLVVPYGDYGSSLSVMNGYLFVSHDGNYST